MAIASLNGRLQSTNKSKMEAVQIWYGKPTYRYAKLSVPPVATPTDFIMIQGSATNTITIKRIKLSGVATGAGNMPCAAIRRTSMFTTQGTAVFNNIPAAQHDTLDVVGTANVAYISTANFTTVGAGNAVLAADRLQLAASGSGIGFQPLDWDFSVRNDKALILRGIGDFIFINLNGAAVPAGTVIDIEIETEEDNS